MSSSSPLVTTLSVKEKAIDWRPHAHHTLYRSDSHFDSRFNAYLRCEMHLMQLYENVVCSHHENLVEKLTKSVNAAATSTNSSSSNSLNSNNSNLLHLDCVSSSLSNPDLIIVIAMLKEHLDASNAVIVDSLCNNIDSAYDILCEIVENLRVLTDESKRAEKRSAAVNSTTFSKPKSWAACTMKDMPSRAIVDTLAFFEESRGKKGLVLIMRNVERIDSEVFSNLLELIHGLIDQQVHVHIITFNSSMCALPLSLCKSAQHLVETSISGTITPWEIYDDFIGRVVSAQKLPVSLTAEVWQWIHESFWRSSCCVRTALDRILLVLSRHFAYRCSLLCMFEESQWLLEMKLIRKSGKTDEEKINQAIHDLLSYMDVDDIKGTGLALTYKGTKGRNSEVIFAKRKLVVNLRRLRVDRNWFRCLRATRDTCLVRQTDGQRREFCSDILWASATSTSSQISSQVNDLIEAVAKNLLCVPVVAINRLILQFETEMTEVGTHLDAIFQSVNEEENSVVSSALSPDVSGVSKAWRRTKETITEKYHLLKDELGEHKWVFEEMLMTMRSFCIPVDATQSDLPKITGSARRHKDKKDGNNTNNGDDDDSLQSPKKSGALFSAPSGSGGLESPSRKSPIISSQIRSPAAKSPVRSQFNQNSFTSPIRNSKSTEDGNVGTGELFSPGGSRLAPLQSPDGNGTMFEGSMFTFTEIAIEDFIKWLRLVTTFFQSIPRNEAISGILDVNPEAVKSALTAANGSIRSFYLQSLTTTGAVNNSNSSFSSSSSSGDDIQSDVSVLAEIVMKSVSTTNIFDWFDAFCNNCQQWDPTPASGAGNKKRKREKDIDLSEATVLKCKFVNALADLERLGVVKTRSGGMEVSRIAYMWMNA
jgi:hypothetical protein